MRVMQEDIVKHLQPIQQNVADVKQEELGFQRKRRRTTSLQENSPLADNFYKKLRQQDRDLDTLFGIYFDRDNFPRIGSKPITISGDDIIIEGQVYDGTPGLWSLITSKSPEGYDRDDL